MFQTYEFLKSVLNTMKEHVVVIDSNGAIVYVNEAWVMFGINNDYPVGDYWRGTNYLAVCDKSAKKGDKIAIEAAEGIRKVINNKEKLFYIEYPCHSENERRWFMMRVSAFKLKNKAYYVISHENITELKLAEEKILNLSRIDVLTNIPNRRYFNEFFEEEWKRCIRFKLPLSLAMIDIDHFKLLNDTYGHQAGDECLKKIGETLGKFGRRPDDIVARYGGEEFIMALGNTTIENSLKIVNELSNLINDLKIPNKKSSVIPTVTVSIGLSTVYPNENINKEELIKHADILLYKAKESGRNKVIYELY